MADTTEVKKPTEQVLDISDSNVQSKYKEAGRIADGNDKEQKTRARVFICIKAFV